MPSSRPVLTKVALTKNSDNSVLSEMLFIFKPSGGSDKEDAVAAESVLLYPPTKEQNSKLKERLEDCKVKHRRLVGMVKSSYKQ